MASTGWSCASRPKVVLPGTSAWVSTGRTPGAVSAAVVSIETIRAWGCGLRSVAPHSIPSRWRSLAYSNSPFTLGTPSTRRTDSPTPPCRRMLTLMPPPCPPPEGEGKRSSSCPDHGGLAEIDQVALMNDWLSLNEKMLDRPRIAEHERRYRVAFRATEGQAVGCKERDVGALADLERADIVPAQARRPATGGHAQRLARAHRRGTLAPPGGEHRLARLGQQVAAVVGGRSIDGETNLDAGVDHLASRR